MTLADGMGGRRDQGPALHLPGEHNPRAGGYSRHKLCYHSITIRDCLGQQAALAMTMGEICYEKDTVRLPRQDLSQAADAKLYNAIPPFATG